MDASIPEIWKESTTSLSYGTLTPILSWEEIDAK